MEESKYLMEMERIKEIINNKDIVRMGKLFSTCKNNYFYDTGTGKVICLDEESYYTLNKWYHNELYGLNEFSELIKVIHEEKLLRAIKAKTLYNPQHFEFLDENVHSKMEQLILELTGKCNLRCTYCVYNDTYVYARAFNSDDMSQEIAKKAIDYFFEHSEDEIAITYYGGEPLVKFDLLKWSILYVLEKNSKYNKKVSFSLTSNMTLMTSEMAEFFASISEVGILCSIDGPQEVHDSYRLKVDGSGSFKSAIKGLEILSQVYRKYNRHISINTVFAPPFTFEKLDKINDFFSSLDFLPKDTRLAISYPSTGSITEVEKWMDMMQSNPRYKDELTGDINPLWMWRKNKINEGFPIEVGDYSIITSDLQKMFNFVDQRIITSEPNNLFPLNACCVPAKRRLFVSSKGKYYPCERIGTSPDIGDVDNGVSVERIRKYYINDFIEKSINKCSNCWAVKMCQLCYAGRYDDNGFIGSTVECEGTRLMVGKMLSQYHELLEGNHEKLKFLENVEVN